MLEQCVALPVFLSAAILTSQSVHTACRCSAAHAPIRCGCSHASFRDLKAHLLFDLDVCSSLQKCTLKKLSVDSHIDIISATEHLYYSFIIKGAGQCPPPSEQGEKSLIAFRKQLFPSLPNSSANSM